MEPTFNSKTERTNEKNKGRKKERKINININIYINYSLKKERMNSNNSPIGNYIAYHLQTHHRNFKLQGNLGKKLIVVILAIVLVSIIRGDFFLD